eukprot:TRINITY_DN3709_c0_g2_i1.p1 TRINITY_DN3709_c0_g2~~TRINITY_DN3709_c0_g2_i1.p1  ORF type:complete len:499 (-),score=121.38 TRINITY_DN3709_c0_g2_i1:22-1518(-)
MSNSNPQEQTAFQPITKPKKTIKKSPSSTTIKDLTAPYTIQVRPFKSLALNPLYGHSCLVYKNIIHLVGGCDPNGRGIDEIVRYHTVEKKWLTPVQREGSIKGSHFHCSTLYRDELFIFGGRCNSYTNEITKLSLIDEKWTRVKAQGSPPAPRFGATGVRLKDNFFIFGGYDNSGMACNDLFVFSLTNNTWTAIKPSTGKPLDRKHHTAVITKEKYLKGKSSFTVHNKDAIVLAAPSDAPTATMLVFGGMDEKGNGMNDLWQFDFNKQQWSPITTKGRQPKPLYGHSAFANKEGFMFISGGFKSPNKKPSSAFYCLDLHNLTWHKIKTDHKIPPRFHHSICELTPNFFFLFGGTGGNKVLTDVYQIELIPHHRVISSTDLLQGPNSSPYQILGKDVWLYIFSYLSWKDLFACDSVCKYFWMMSHSEWLWERILYSHHPELKQQHEEEKKHCSIPITGFRASFISKKEKYQMYIWDEQNPWGKEYKTSELFWRANQYLN